MAMLGKSISICGNRILHFFFQSRTACSSHFVSCSDSSPPSRPQRSIVSGDLHLSTVRDANLGHFHYDSGGVVGNSDGVLRDSDGSSINNHHHPRYDPTNNMFNSSHQPPPHRRLPPDYREWERADSNPISPNKSFRILSYNLLADYLANSHTWRLYRHIPPHILQWQRRKTCIINELGFWSPDLMCFQEVDKFHELEWELRIHGYNGIWKQRTGNCADGCAIFWRSSTFNLLHEESIEFNNLGLRNNIAQICVLEMVDRNHKLVLSNTHVLYNPKRPDIKLAQIRLLLQKVHTISNNWNNAPVTLCGDFNCTPDSPIYNFIAYQKLDFTDLNWYNMSGQISAEIHPWINACVRDADTAIRLKTGVSFSRIRRTDPHTLNFSRGCSYGSSDFDKGGEEQDGEDCISMNSLVEGVENSDVFLSELHGDDGESSSSCMKKQDERKWTYAEMEIATGREEHGCRMEHTLKLTSSYTEVGSVSTGRRDCFGEPLATSYNRCFFGTVDYIWRSEGLRTLAVLAPIPKKAMIWTQGFPTPKWGSDHIALVSEFTFLHQRGSIVPSH